MKVNYVNATPRSKVFKYYTSGQGGSGGSTTPYNPPYVSIDATGEVLINTVGSGNVVQSVTVNTEDNTVMDVTIGNAVTKIVAGNNITINPTSGVGDVTINSSGGVSLNSSGSGNTVTDLTLSGTALTKTLGNRYSGLMFAGSGSTVTNVSEYNATTLLISKGNIGLSDITAGTNITIDKTNPYVPVISASGGGSTSITWNTTTDTTSNLDFLTDASSASGSTVTARYKRLVAGTNVTLAQSGNNVTISATGGGGSVSVDGTTIYNNSNVLIGNRIKVAEYSALNNVRQNAVNYDLHTVTATYKYTNNLLAGNYITVQISPSYTNSTVFGLSCSGCVKDSNISIYDKQLKVFGYFDTNNILTIVIMNESTVTIQNYTAFISFFTTRNPSTIYPN